ncbi:MAG: lipopolysaccharide biosynthesis protein [Clostridia bacterium]|nr:lipopolysaccharide biosynthesis protein [Clostridia bacterium]
MSVLNALKWSFMGELASKAIQPVVFIVLARLLTPEDFGVMTAALMVLAFSQIFWEAGMGKALIQRQSDVQDAANVAFWVNLGIAVLIAGLLYIAASPIALTFFQDPRVTSVIQVMTLQVVLGALGSVQTALLQKDMDFKKLFWVRFVTVCLPGLASIPLAWQGVGYWALVVGTLVGQAVQVVMLWRMSTWRPSWSFHAPVAKEMGRFGAWVGLSGLLAWFYAWMDALIVGMYLGSHDLGLFRTGNQFSMMVFALLFGPIIPVLYSHLSRMNGDRDRIKMAAEKVIKTLVIIAVPVAVILFSVSDSVGAALFGEQWKGIGFVIGVMALTHGFSWVVSMNGEFYRAMGKPAHETMVMSGPLFVYLAGYLYSIGFGFEYFVWTRLAMTLLVGVILQLIVLQNTIKIGLCATLRYITMVASISFFVTFSFSFFLKGYDFNSWIQFLVSASLSAIAIGGALFYLERDKMVREFVAMSRRVGQLNG